MTFGQVEGGPGASIFKVDQAGANSLVAQARDAGINFFNTADVYAGGQSEEMLGRALGTGRSDAVIATKVGNRMGHAITSAGLSRRHILLAAENSLRRLGTDWIDVYLFHRIDPLTPLEEMLEAADSLVRAGKVRYVGFSNWPAWMAAKAVGIQAARCLTRLRAAEMYYSLAGRDLEHELIPFAQDAGIGMTIWSPLAGGLLSGRYTREDPGGGEGRLTGFDFIPGDREKAYAIVDQLCSIGARYQASPAQIALAWLLARPAVSSIIVGASLPAQLAENLGAAALTLAPADIDLLDRLTDPGLPYPHWFTAKTSDFAVGRALAGTQA